MARRPPALTRSRAIHANIPFEKVPIDYLYNVINHGGAAMGKSPSMPYWTAKPLACAQCHGEQGDGQGLLGAALVPPPRNFTCGQTMKDIPDGQLFWIIKNGSPGTGRMAFAGMPDEEVWQVIRYLRSLGR